MTPWIVLLATGVKLASVYLATWRISALTPTPGAWEGECQSPTDQRQMEQMVVWNSVEQQFLISWKHQHHFLQVSAPQH